MEPSDLSRLAPADPWTVIAEARAQRGPIVASWLAALIARMRMPRPFTVNAS